MGRSWLRNQYTRYNEYVNMERSALYSGRPARAGAMLQSAKKLLGVAPTRGNVRAECLKMRIWQYRVFPLLYQGCWLGTRLAGMEDCQPIS
jgi:hypothetical protein